MAKKALGFELLLILTAAATAAAIAIGISAPAPASSSTARYEMGESTYLNEPMRDWPQFRALGAHTLRQGDLMVFGSSELGSVSPTVIYKYVPKLCGTRTLAVGHAGYQSLSILLHLLQLDSALGPHSRIAIILSPGWYNEHGTSTQRFLESVSAEDLVEFAANPGIPKMARAAIQREVRTHRDEISSLSPVWALWSFPFLHPFLRQSGFLVSRPLTNSEVSVTPLGPAIESVDKDLVQYRQLALTRLSENPYGVTKEFWPHIQHKKLPYANDALDFWAREEQDTLALSNFLSERGVHAQFIVQPMNRRINKGWEEYDRLFARLLPRLAQDGHRVFNPFVEPYDLTWLLDRGHFSEYGWLRVDQEVCSWLHSN